MRHSLLKRAIWLCLLCSCVSCALPAVSSAPPTSAPPALRQTAQHVAYLPQTPIAAPDLPATATTVPTVLPTATLLSLPSTAQDLAWLWLPQVDPEPQYAASFWHFGVPWRVEPSDLIAVTASGHQRLLGHNVTDILDRPNNSPLAILPVSTTHHTVPPNHLAVLDPATGVIVADRQIKHGGLLAPDGTEFAARVPIPSSPDQILNAIQVTNITTGITSTFDVFDNYTLHFTNVLLAWGPHTIYGATHDRWIHTLWWINLNAAHPERQRLGYGVDSDVDEVEFNTQTDMVAYTWMPNIFTSSTWVMTTALMLRNTQTNEERLADTGEQQSTDIGPRFTDITLSPSGQYLAYLHRDADHSPISELRLYDITHPGSPRTIHTSLIPWEVWDNGNRASGDIYEWSPDSAYVLVLTAGRSEDQSKRRRALIFRTQDGTLIASTALPDDTGSLRLTDDLRLIMVTYQGKEAYLAVYDLKTQTAYQPIPLGARTPIIVYMPKS